MAEAVKDPVLRSGYMAMAAGWHSLAQEAEKLAVGDAPIPVPHKPAQPERNGN
jgi:hypothetical protein